MNQWDIYTEAETSNSGIGIQESFVFSSHINSTSGIGIGIGPGIGPGIEGINAKTLESVLPTQGWPKAELSEVNAIDSESVLQLLLPTLAKLNAQKRWITLISPPADINQKLFAYYGIDTSRVLLIHPRNDVDDKATMNKALKNGTSGIVILWASQLNKRYLAQWRKSVKQGNSTGIIVNLSQEYVDSESIALSFDVSSSEKTLLVTGIKLFGVKQTQKDEILFSKIDLHAIPGQQLLRNHHQQTVMN